MIRVLAPALLLALAACGQAPSPEDDLAQLDRELAGANGAAVAGANGAAVAAAAGGPIMVDPGLAQAANADAVRPPDRPDTGSTPPADIAAMRDGVDSATLRRAPAAAGTCPECRAASGALTLAALAGRQASPRMAGCAAAIGYSAAWANRLPADLPLYPDARIVEAAGTERDGCRLRVVTFVSSAPPGRLVDWYYTRATGGGYSAEHRAEGTRHVVAGTRGGDAYVAYVAPRAGGGSDVDLVVNAGT